MEYAVSLEGTTLVTLHEGTDTTARDEAVSQLGTSLAELAAENAIADWEIGDAEVYEHPTAPFDPYTVTVAFAVTVVIEADDAAAAEAGGADAIDDALESGGLDAVSYTAGPTASTA